MCSPPPASGETFIDGGTIRLYYEQYKIAYADPNALVDNTITIDGTNIKVPTATNLAIIAAQYSASTEVKNKTLALSGLVHEFSNTNPALLAGGVTTTQEVSGNTLTADKDTILTFKYLINNPTTQVNVLNNSLIGGFNTGGALSGNKVEVNGATLKGHAVIAGSKILLAATGSVNGNTVTANNIKLSSTNESNKCNLKLCGADVQAISATVINNTVILDGGLTIEDTTSESTCQIYGTDAELGEIGTIQDNKVIIKNSLPITNAKISNGLITGALFLSTSSRDRFPILCNEVELSGDISYINVRVLGAYCKCFGVMCENNSVFITKAKFSIDNGYSLIGAVNISDDHFFETARNNIISIIGSNEDINLSGAYLIGAFQGDLSQPAVDATDFVNNASHPKSAHGSTLFVATNNVTAAGAYLFDEIQFVLPRLLNATDPMLTLASKFNLIGKGATTKTIITVDRASNNTIFNQGDKIILLKDEAGIENFDTIIADDYIISLVDNNRLVLTVLGNRQSNADAATRSISASAASVNGAMDLVASSMIRQLDQAGSTLSAMAASSIGTSRVITGSHVDVTSGNLVLGASKAFKYVNTGIFVEGGLSQFDCYENAKVGSGNSKFMGLGVAAKLDYKKTYLASSIHGGFLKVGSNFNANTSYFGGFLECGYHLHPSLNTYARYSYGRTGAMDITLDDTKQDGHFDATQSHRIRIGAKLSARQLKINPYAGLAYEHEFKGETSSVIVGSEGIASPGLKGDTGIIELGFTASFTKRLKVSFDFTTTFGCRCGISGGVGASYKL